MRTWRVCGSTHAFHSRRIMLIFGGRSPVAYRMGLSSMSWRWAAYSGRYDSSLPARRPALTSGFTVLMRALAPLQCSIWRRPTPTSANLASPCCAGMPTTSSQEDLFSRRLDTFLCPPARDWAWNWTETPWNDVTVGLLRMVLSQVWVLHQMASTHNCLVI